MRKGPIGPMPSLQEQINAFLSAPPHGWCSRDKAQMIVDLVALSRPKLAVEIGVFGGASLIVIGMAMRAHGGGLVVGIDPWKTDDCLEGMTSQENVSWWKGVDLEAVMRSCLAFIDRFDLPRHVQVIRGRGEEGAFSAGTIDLLHLDGNHSEEPSVRTVEKYLPCVKNGGIILFDDVNWIENGKRTQEKALGLLLSQCKELRRCDQGNCVAMEKL